MDIRQSTFIAICLWFISSSFQAESAVLEITEDNHNETIANSELAVLTFYAPWCGYSTMFAPAFEAASNKVAEIYSEDSKIVFGRVNGDIYHSIMKFHKVNKFPTTKLVRYGFFFHNEYRGSRTVEGVVEYVNKQMENPTHFFDDIRDIVENNDDKKMVIGYFASDSSKHYDTFTRLAKSLRDDCSFYAGFGDASRVMRSDNQDLIVFRADKTAPPELDDRFTGDYENFTQLIKWAYPQCFPLVREITFENAEGITEESQPMFILFYHPNNKQIKQAFTKVVEEILNNTNIYHLQLLNFLTADGLQFSHPLQSLNRSEQDLPLLALDSLTHMYLYPDTADILDPESIKKFAADWYSGKLHREFHYGPDSTPKPPSPSESEEDPSPEGDTSGEDDEDNEIESSENGPSAPEVEETSPPAEETSPPESVFIKLAPSEKRYSLLRDEF